MAVALKRENPARTATQVRRILRAQMGWAPGRADPATPLRRRPADRRDARRARRRRRPARGGVRPVRGRPPQRAVDRGRPARPARSAGARPTCSRSSTTTPGRSSGTGSGSPRTPCAWPPRCARRSGSRGVPDGIYVDNGSAFVDAWLLRACAKLGIRLIHSTPGRPQGRGKIERFFRTVREQFLVEITGETTGDGADPGRHPVADLDELNRLFTAWVETVYHRRSTPRPGSHRSRAGTPAARSRCPTPAALAEAFLWEEHRTVTKTALVSLQGNTYQVDPLLVGRRVELVFDPFDLTRIAGPAARRPGRDGDPAPDRAPRPPQGPTRDPTRAAGADRDRLRPPHRRRPPRRARPGRQLRRPRRQRPRQPTSTAPTSTHRPARPDSSTCSPTSTSPTARLTARWRRDRPAARVLRVHPHPVRPRPRPRDAAPPRRPRRGRRPDRLVRHRAPDRGDHRRGRRREDRRRPRRARRPGPHPAHHHLPAQPDGRGPRHPPPDRRRPRRTDR